MIIRTILSRVSLFEWGVIGSILIVVGLVWIATNIEDVAAFLIKLENLIWRTCYSISKRFTGERYFLVYYRGFKKYHQIYPAKYKTFRRELRKRHNAYLKSIGKEELINKHKLIVKVIWL